MKIELLEVRPGDYTVIVSGQGFADRLCRDEALGVVAACLYGAKPPYLRTYEQWVAWEIKYLREPIVQPVALLGCNTWSQQ
jgi:hypothetical protein